MDEINADIERRVDAMTESQREHLRTLIYDLVKCYDEESPNNAVILFGTNDGLEDVLTLGSSPMQTANMLSAATDLFEFLNTRDAPPKEKFN